MIIKKISRIIACAAGIMSMLVCINTFSIPVCAAQNNIKSEFSYNQSLMNKELKNNVIEQDGNKITVDNICGSNNKIKVHLTFESNKSFKDYYGSQINIRMEGCENEGAGDSSYLINDNKIEYKADIDSQKGFSETGIIRVDIVDGYRDINASLKIPVDFKEDFQKNYVKDLSGEIKNTGISIKQFVSNNVQTGVVLSWPESDDYMEYVGKDNFLINVDDKIYLVNETDNFMKDNDNNELIIVTSRDLSYNQIKDGKKVTIMNYYNSMTDEELDKYYESYDIKDSLFGEISEGDNSGADFSVKFNDRTEGKIKVVKENDKVKLYCSSDSDKKSMLMAVNTFGVYYDKSNDCYEDVENKTIYKDKNVDNQYIIEFNNNVEKDKTLSLLMEKTILEYDKFVIGDEITVK